MKVEQSSLLGMLGAPDTRFTIPAYQRRYAWQERQCEELWLDILRAGRRDEGHFSGTVLFKEIAPDASDTPESIRGRGIRELSIVDGQQRITTVMLMLAALRSYLRTHPEVVIEGFDAEDIEKRYLFADANEQPIDPSDAAPKLTPSRLDAASMKLALAGVPADNIPSHNISQNLTHFEELMAKDSFDPRLFIKGLKNLSIVAAQTTEEDDSQAVFESLNSKGMQLNIADMVRNYLLAGENYDDQTRFYIDYWTVIEGVFDPDPGSLKLDTMIKAWLSVRFPKVRARTPDDVYSAFKRYYDDEYAGDLEPVLAELRSFAMVWAENYRYHAVKKFKSMPWAINGPTTLTSDYELKKADDEEYAERVRQELRAMDRNF